MRVTDRTELREPGTARWLSAVVSDELARVLASGDPEVWRRLLTEHVPDRAGRCRRCEIGGGAGRYRWPCRLQVAAAAARNAIARSKRV